MSYKLSRPFHFKVAIWKSALLISTVSLINMYLLLQSPWTPQKQITKSFYPFLQQQGVIGPLALCLYFPNSSTHSAAFSSVQHCCLGSDECGWRGVVGKVDICSPSVSHVLDLSFNVRAQNCSWHSKNPLSVFVLYLFNPQKFLMRKVLLSHLIHEETGL